MPSLRQLLAAHAPLLLLDAASAKIQVGWLAGDPAAWRWAESDEEAGVGVFRCLEQIEARPHAAGAFVFCDGPGSVLGVRSVAVALRAWGVIAPRAVYSFSSLALVANSLNAPDVTVIADARRELWHTQKLSAPLRRLPSAELRGDLVMPEGFRHWSPLPAGVRQVPYSLSTMLPVLMDRDFFVAREAPDAFLHEEPSYVAWNRQIHRAP